MTVDLRARAAAAMVYAGNPTLSTSARRDHAIVAVESIALHAAAEGEQRAEPYLQTHGAEHEQLAETLALLTRAVLVLAQLQGVFPPPHGDALTYAVHELEAIEQADRQRLRETPDRG